RARGGGVRGPIQHVCCFGADERFRRRRWPELRNGDRRRGVLAGAARQYPRVRARRAGGTPVSRKRLSARGRFTAFPRERAAVPCDPAVLTRADAPANLP